MNNNRSNFDVVPTPSLSRLKGAASERRVKPTRVIVTAAGVLMVLAAQTAISSAQLVQNGDFEQPAFQYDDSSGLGNATSIWAPATIKQSEVSSRIYYNTFEFLPPGSKQVTGWSIGKNGVVRSRYAGFYGYGTTSGYCVILLYNPDSGSYHGGSIYQDIYNLEVGTTYYLSFDLYQNELSAASTVTLGVGSDTFPQMNSTFTVWQTHTVAFTASSNSTRISFSMPDVAAPHTLIDSVKISTNKNAVVSVASKLMLGIKVEGSQGKTYRVEYAEQLTPTVWNFLSRKTVGASPAWVYDEVAGSDQRRFYRTVEE